MRKIILPIAIGMVLYSIQPAVRFLKKPASSKNKHLWSTKDQFGNQYCMYKCGVVRSTEISYNWLGYPKKVPYYEFKGVKSVIGYTCPSYRNGVITWPGFPRDDD